MMIATLALFSLGSAQSEKIKDIRKVIPESPVLINFWATWCGPCRYELPRLVQIESEYRDRNLKVVLISLDRPSFAESLVPEFLRQYGITFPSYILDFWNRRERNRAIGRVVSGFNGGLPLTVLLDEHGKRVFTHTGVFEEAALRKQIEEKLSKTR